MGLPQQQQQQRQQKQQQREQEGQEQPEQQEAQEGQEEQQQQQLTVGDVYEQSSGFAQRKLSMPSSERPARQRRQRAASASSTTQEGKQRVKNSMDAPRMESRGRKVIGSLCGAGDVSELEGKGVALITMPP